MPDFIRNFLTIELIQEAVLIIDFVHGILQRIQRLFFLVLNDFESVE
jgi:hypothetical protein